MTIREPNSEQSAAWNGRTHAIADTRDRVQIMRLDGTTRAQRAWERTGFDVRAAYRSERFSDVLGGPGLKLLVREP